MNVVALSGRLSRPPEERVLDSGTRLMSLQVTVEGAERAETVPVVWFDPRASALDLDADAAVVVVGRVRRRFYQAGGRTQSRTEVVAEKVVDGRRAAPVRTLLATVVERVAAELEPGGAPAAGRRRR